MACVIYIDHRRVSKKLHEDFVSELYGIYCFRILQADGYKIFMQVKNASSR